AGFLGEPDPASEAHGAISLVQPNDFLDRFAFRNTIGKLDSGDRKIVSWHAVIQDNIGWLPLGPGWRIGSNPGSQLIARLPTNQLRSKRANGQRAVKVQHRSVLRAVAETRQLAELAKLSFHVDQDIEDGCLQAPRAANRNVIPRPGVGIEDIA